jgi:hypothetical protein
MHTYDMHTYVSFSRARRDEDRDFDMRTKLSNSGARAERNTPSEKRDRQTDDYKDDFELRRETSSSGYVPVSDDAGLFIPGEDDVRTSYDDLYRAESSVMWHLSCVHVCIF